MTSTLRLLGFHCGYLLSHGRAGLRPLQRVSAEGFSLFVLFFFPLGKALKKMSIGGSDFLLEAFLPPPPECVGVTLNSNLAVAGCRVPFLRRVRGANVRPTSGVQSRPIG